MSIRLSDVGEYSQAIAENGSRARQLPEDVVPATLPREALTRSRGAHGLALTEVSGPRRQSLSGRLGELVQVVT